MKTILVVLQSYLFLSISNIVFAQTNVENYNFEYIPEEDTIQKEKKELEYDFVDFDCDEPQFKGGYLKLFAFIKKHLVYPQSMSKICIQGNVIISFIVKKDGSLSDFKVEKSVHPDLDNEALRVVMLMPKWIPAIQGDEKVTLPIRFY